MTNSKNTKKSLYASALALLLCFVMLIGTTFAWFTDSASTGVNVIKSGNLELSFEYSEDMQDWKNAENATDLFADAKWEPGFTKVVYFKVTNTGDLAFDYKLATNVVKEIEGVNQAGETFKLSDYLQFGITECDTVYSDSKSARDAVTTPNKLVNVGTNEWTLTKGQNATLALTIWMPEETGNIANHNGITVPEIQLGVQVLATQAKVEADSFGTNYDANATYPAGPKLDAIVATPGTAEELHDILETALTGGSASGTITINLDQDFDLANSWTTVDNSNYSGVNKVVINGNGHSISNLNQPLLSKTFGGNEGSLEFKNITIKDSTITVAGTEDEGVGVFLNTADSSNLVKFTNCTLDSVNITNTGAESYLGGFVGHASSDTLKFENCIVKNCNLAGKKDIGAFVGYTTSTMTVTGGNVSGTTINSSNASTYRVGLIAGTVNENPATINGLTVGDGNTVTQGSASTAKTSDYVGRVLAAVTVS